jgi:hypothetical protein
MLAMALLSSHFAAASTSSTQHAIVCTLSFPTCPPSALTVSHSADCPGTRAIRCGPQPVCAKDSAAPLHPTLPVGTRCRNCTLPPHTLRHMMCTLTPVFACSLCGHACIAPQGRQRAVIDCRRSVDVFAHWCYQVCLGAQSAYMPVPHQWIQGMQHTSWDFTCPVENKSLSSGRARDVQGL